MTPPPLFGPNGIRGTANVYPMTAATALAVGRAVAHVLRRDHTGINRILIGKDTRISGYMLENALTAGVCSVGVDAFVTGPVPTPGIAYLTRTMRCVAGIVVTASHEPAAENGLLIFDSLGFPIGPDVEAEIEPLVRNGVPDDASPTGAGLGRAKRIDDVKGRYIEFCKGTYPSGTMLEGVRIVLDCANGSTYRVAPDVFRELGASVSILNASPNGMNVNRGCGASAPDELRRAVVENKADLGLAFDGDGDRLIAVDETGRALSGDVVLAICARHLKSLGKLQGARVVVTKRSGEPLRACLRTLGIAVVEADPTQRGILARMRAVDASLGGDPAGHLIFRDLQTTGDGIVTALQLLSVMDVSGKPLSALASIVDP